MKVIQYKPLMDKLVHKNLTRKADEREIKILSKLQMWYFNTELRKEENKDYREFLQGGGDNYV